MVRSFAVLWVLLTLNFITLTCIAGAQTNTATLSGTVIDTQGAVVPNVAVDEFSLQTQGAAEYGRNSGAINPRLGEGGPRVVQFGLKFIF
jgi:hypothetical protein